MSFAYKLVKNLEAGTLIDEYSDQEFFLPNALKERNIQNIIHLRSSPMMEHFVDWGNSALFHFG